MKNRIIEICELGQPQSIIHRENQPITELIKTTDLVDELNEQLRIGGVASSALVEIENPYIEDADSVVKGDIYDVTGRVSKCWILENDFDNIKCTHN